MKSLPPRHSSDSEDRRNIDSEFNKLYKRTAVIAVNLAAYLNMAVSRVSSCVVVQDDEAYPQVHSRPQMPVKCCMEHCQWIGDADSLEKHHSNNHSPYPVKPVEYHDATHLLTLKENTEAVGSLQDEVQRNICKVSQGSMELAKDVGALKSRFKQLKKLQSQSSQNAEPVVPQRNVISNQQSVGANSTASLGRANQQEPPLHERSSTLDAQGSNLQHFVEECEQQDDDQDMSMEYDKPHPQSDQRCDKEALVVGGLAADNQQPPPLPPKPDKSQPLQESSVPPPLPPKPNSNPPPPPPRKSSLRPPAGGQDIPPPLPPKPGQNSSAKPAVPQRRQKKSPSPSLTTMVVHDAQSTAHNEAIASANSCRNPECTQLIDQLKKENVNLVQENNSLVQKNERMKGVIRNNIIGDKSNTCPSSVRSANPLQSKNRLRTGTL